MTREKVMGEGSTLRGKQSKDRTEKNHWWRRLERTRTDSRKREVSPVNGKKNNAETIKERKCSPKL